MSADAQLERLLYILPLATRAEGVRVDELARTLGVSPATVLHDLEEATARAYYHPAGTVESFTILIDGDRVQVHAPDQFRRPVRLTQREALALGLGLRALATEVVTERRGDVLAFAANLETQLVAPDDLAQHGDASQGGSGDIAGGVEYEPDMLLSIGNDVFRGIIADAIDRSLICILWYVKAGEASPEQRRIAPHRLLYAEGQWYVAAHDLDRDDLRFFRLDRVIGIDVTEEEAEAAPDDVDLEVALIDGIAFVASDDREVQIRYDDTVARWVAERTQQPADEDGTVTLRHRVADARWLVRHVLQYGGAAKVESPRDARRWVARAAERMIAQTGE